ncbi:EO6 protein [Japanese eel endothelial cells-infecting virus]|uniref:EO6 protein n=1 Tax=Japanese eel endothelial cells-infecting virus TaxID=712037 RepID=UPI00052E5AB8|nr:EO6 protein [Japanese eel endothelial cells-infecting virus]
MPPLPSEASCAYLASTSPPPLRLAVASSIILGMDDTAAPTPDARSGIRNGSMPPRCALGTLLPTTDRTMSCMFCSGAIESCTLSPAPLSGCSSARIAACRPTGLSEYGRAHRHCSIWSLHSDIIVCTSAGTSPAPLSGEATLRMNSAARPGRCCTNAPVTPLTPFSAITFI